MVLDAHAHAVNAECAAAPARAAMDKAGAEPDSSKNLWLSAATNPSGFWSKIKELVEPVTPRQFESLVPEL